MKIKSEVMDVLAKAEIKGDGIKLAGGQIDRKLYIAVDKILKEAGGKWNRKAGVHLFDSADANSVLDMLISTGQVTTRRETGFFETPSPTAADLVIWAGVKPGDKAIEPSAGTGCIAKELTLAGADVTVCERSRLMLTDLANIGYETFGEEDFLDVDVVEFADVIVMNPPFTKVGKGNHLDHVRRAFEMLKPGGVLVSILPISVEFRSDRRHIEFRAWYEELDGKLKHLPPNIFAGTSVRTVALRIVKPS